MKNIIQSADWLHPDFMWNQPDGQGQHISIPRDEVLAGVAHWRNILRERADFKKGSVLVSAQEVFDIRYLSLFLAVWDLGGIFASAEAAASNELYDQIDCFVYNEGHIQNYNLYELISDRAKCVLEAGIWFDYVADTSNIPPLPTVSPNDIAVRSVYHDFNDKPVFAEQTHEFMYHSSIRQKHVLDLRDDDRVMHLRVLVHNGIETMFLLPTLRFCANHYADIGKNPDRIPAIVHTMAQEKITRVDCLGSKIIDQLLASAPVFEHTIIFYQTIKNKSEWLPLIKEKNISKIISMYSSRKTSGPVLCSTLRQTDESFDPTHYGMLLDDFYQVNLTNDDCLEIYNPLCGRHVLNDQFKLENNNFYFLVANLNK